MASQEINNCEYNTDLGMRYYGRPTTFCSDLYVGGNLIVTGAITEGEALPPAAVGGAGPCFEQIKIIDGFLVEGDACFEQSINLKKDLLVGGNFASKKVRVFEDCKIDKALCVGSFTKLNDSAEVSGDFKVSGRFLIGEGSVDCSNPDLPEVKAVCDGTFLVTDVVYAPSLVLSSALFSTEVVTDTVRTKKLVVNEHVYRERTIEVIESGIPVLLTVLVKDAKETTPEPPGLVKSCPISVPCVVVPAPNPPCPTIDC